MAREFESIKGYKSHPRAGEPINTGEMQHFMDFLKFLYQTNMKNEYQPQMKDKKLKEKYDSFLWSK